MTTSRTHFALALLQMDGVGRVTAGRLLSHFDDFEDLHRYPREQVLHRIKGARNAETLVNNLFDETFLSEHLDFARAHLEKLSERNIAVIVQNDERWPPGLDALERSKHPVRLYAYGNTDALNVSGTALFASPPLADRPFEWAQDLARRLLQQQKTVVTGVANGFDSVIQKLSLSAEHSIPSLMIANCGLAQIPTGLRSIASRAVRAGSLMVSSFPMTHGPFSHDDYERALLQTALIERAIFIHPEPETPEWRAMKWALEHDRELYVLPHPDHTPPEPVTVITVQTPVQDITSSHLSS